MYKKLLSVLTIFSVLFVFFSSSLAHEKSVKWKKVCKEKKCWIKKKDFEEFKKFKEFKKKKFDLSKYYSKKFCFPFSIPYNIPDGWILTHINLDEENQFTRIFTFKDITNECRYFVKNDREYQAWCTDQNLIGTPDYDYMVRLFNILQDLPDYGTFDTPKGEVDLYEFLYTDYRGDRIPYDKVLYIINNRDGYSKAEVQEAIWYYTMGDGYFDPETTGYMELVNAAEMYGDGYIPPCDGKLFAFAITRAAENTSELQPCELGQPFIVELPIPRWMCRFGFLERFLERFYND